MVLKITIAKAQITKFFSTHETEFILPTFPTLKSLFHHSSAKSEQFIYIFPASRPFLHANPKRDIQHRASKT